MKKTMYVVFLALFSLCIGKAQSLDQQVVSSSGTTITGASNTLSFTVGETSIGPITNGVALEQGFWNGAIIGLSIGYDDFSFETQPTAYPNPVANHLNVHFTEMEGQDFNILIYDTNGREVFRQELTNSSVDELLNFSSFSQGIYLLKIIQSSTKKSKSFKIIKL